MANLELGRGANPGRSHIVLIVVANEAVIGNWRLDQRKGNCLSLGLKVILGMSTCLAVPAMVNLNSLLLIVVSKIILGPLHRPSLELALCLTLSQ